MKLERNNVDLIDLSEPGRKIEYAGKVCYKSQNNITDTSYERFITNIIKSGHCYDEETEVLTSEGFKSWKDVNEETRVAAIDPKTRKIVGFEKPLALISKDVEEDLIRFSTKDIDLKITDGHRLYVAFCNTVEKRLNPENNFELIEANKKIVSKRQHPTKEAWEKPCRFSSTAKNGFKGLDIKDEMFKLFGFFIGDGCATEKNNRLSFHLKKERKLNYLENILKENGIDFEKKSSQKGTFTYNISGEIYKKFNNMFYNENQKKTFPNSFFEMNEKQFYCFLDGLINSDGSIDPRTGSISYSTTSEELEDKLQALFCINDIHFNNKKGINNLNSMVLSKETFPMVNDSRNKKNYARKEFYKGKVYCCQVSTGLLMVRRNGKTCLCGNCSVLEHEGKMFSFDESLYESEIKPLIQYNHYLNITKESNKVFVSGNIRAWYDLLSENDNLYAQGLSTKLSKDYPYIFKDYDIGLNCKYGYDAEKECKDLSKHTIYTFEILGTRSFTHQIVRHRSLSFSQESQRYCNYANGKFDHSVRFILPEIEDEHTFDLVKMHCENCENTYFSLIEDGEKPEDARQVLPNCAATTIVVSGTIDNWKKFLHLRMDKHAQKEIRDIANSIASYLRITKEEVGAE